MTIPFAVANQAQFEEGLGQYSEGKWAEASESFARAAKEPLSPSQKAVIYYNWGLAEYQKKEPTSFGRALAYFRIATELDQSSDLVEKAVSAKAFAISELASGKTLEVTETFWDKLSYQYLIFFSVSGLGFLFWASLTLMLWLVFKAKKSKSHGVSVALISSSILSAFFGLLLAFKIYDMSIERGTILPEKVELKLLPRESGGGQGQLDGGSLVKVVNQTEGWVQVRFGAGALGWIPESEIIIHRTALD